VSCCIPEQTVPGSSALVAAECEAVERLINPTTGGGREFVCHSNSKCSAAARRSIKTTRFIKNQPADRVAAIIHGGLEFIQDRFGPLGPVGRQFVNPPKLKAAVQSGSIKISGLVKDHAALRIRAVGMSREAVQNTFRPAAI